MNAKLVRQAMYRELMEREIREAIIEGTRRYRECGWLGSVCCFDFGDTCIFCGKSKTDPRRLLSAAQARTNNSEATL